MERRHSDRRKRVNNCSWTVTATYVSIFGTPGPEVSGVRNDSGMDR